MSKQAKWQKKMVESGRCPECGKMKKKDCTYYYCDFCRESNRIRMRRAKAGQKIDASWVR